MFMYVAFTKMHNPTNPAPDFRGKSHASLYLQLAHGDGRELRHRLASAAQRRHRQEYDRIVDRRQWRLDRRLSRCRLPAVPRHEGDRLRRWLARADHHVVAGPYSSRQIDGIISHMDFWPTAAALAGLTPPPHGAWVGNDGKPIYFDGIDDSGFVLGKAPSARTSMIYIEGITFLGLRVGDWKFLWTAKDAWLGPDMTLEVPAIYNLKQDPGEAYDKMFNGAAPPVAGMLKTSPGRWSGQDSGWALMMALPPFEDDEVDEGVSQHRHPEQPGAGRRRPAEIRAAAHALLHHRLKAHADDAGRSYALCRSIAGQAGRTAPLTATFPVFVRRTFGRAAPRITS